MLFIKNRLHPVEAIETIGTLLNLIARSKIWRKVFPLSFVLPVFN